MATGEDARDARNPRHPGAGRHKHERLSAADLETRYPQIAPELRAGRIFEPDSGALMARRAVQSGRPRCGGVRRRLPHPRRRSARPRAIDRGGHRGRGTNQRRRVRLRLRLVVGPGGSRALENRIFPTRQEVFFFGVPAGDSRWAPPSMPTWIDFGEEWYGIPDLESRGFKVAPDAHGPAFDPDTGERVVSAEAAARARAFVGNRFPALKRAPIVESRVCQYENTSSGDFVIDRHPEHENVWVVGGGSGHGFKHGPAVGEYLAERLARNDAVEPRFSLATKERSQQRTVF